MSASPAFGNKFTGWSGACTGVGACAITMSSAMSVTATFAAAPPQTLTVSVGTGGTVTSSPSGISCPGTCSAPFTYGTLVTLSDSPSSGYNFAGWSGACSGTGGRAVVMNNAIAVTAAFSQILLINTVAGSGGPGAYFGDGRPATSAKLWSPRSVAVDSAGNFYIADAQNSRIRKVTSSTGIISTVAGGGVGGDGGLATSASLNVPAGVILDSVRNIYIADSNNNRIRKVTVSTGIISTVAGNGAVGFSGDGGAATSASLSLTCAPETAHE